MKTVRLAGAVLLLMAAVTLARATTVVPPTFPELVAESDVIVRAVVTSVRSEEFDSPDGRGIRTLVTLNVERTLKGNPGETLTLSLVGGRVGRRALHIEGVPRFAVGDRQFVFLAGNGQVFCPLVGLGHGRYPIRVDATGRAYVTRENGRPLQSTDDVSLPLALPPAIVAGASTAKALGLDAFEASITAVVSHPELRGREP